jgi:hypothetical protein
MDKSKVKDKCPACGVSAKMFEPYSEKMSPGRKRILSLELHPVLVHFPQAFIISIFVLSLIALAAHGSFRATVAASIIVLGVALPFFIIGAFLAGLLDGKVRFRKVTTPILKQKIVFATLFFLLSCAIFAVILCQPMEASTTTIIVAVLCLPALGCASFLGLLGSSILNAKFPG